MDTVYIYIYIIQLKKDREPEQEFFQRRPTNG